jgi:hypothetical protein
MYFSKEARCATVYQSTLCADMFRQQWLLLGICSTSTYGKWSRLQSTHRVIADFRRSFHHDGKLSPVRDLFHLYPLYVLCGKWSEREVVS